MTLRRATKTLLASALLVAAAMGCGGSGLPDKVKYAAPPQAMLQGGVSVTLKLVHAEEEEMTARFIITNLTEQIMMVNRDGWALRLPDGRVIPRHGHQNMYSLQPNQSHDVHVDFRVPGLDMRTIQTASVIVGGISYINDPMPRVVGEIPVTLAGAVDD